MRPDDMQGWMFQLAKANDGDTHNQVFVMRQVLTKVYMLGFEDGRHAADKDEFVRRHIDEDKAKGQADDDS